MPGQRHNQGVGRELGWRPTLDANTSSVQRSGRHNTQKSMHKQANKLTKIKEQLLLKLNMHKNTGSKQIGKIREVCKL